MSALNRLSLALDAPIIVIKHSSTREPRILLQPSSPLYVVVGWQATKNHHASVRRICGREE